MSITKKTVDETDCLICIDSLTNGATLIELPRAAESIGRILIFFDSTGLANDYPISIICNENSNDKINKELDNISILKTFGSLALICSSDSTWSTFIDSTGFLDKQFMNLISQNIIANSITADKFTGDFSGNLIVDNSFQQSLTTNLYTNTLQATNMNAGSITGINLSTNLMRSKLITLVDQEGNTQSLSYTNDLLFVNGQPFNKIRIAESSLFVAN